MVGSIDPRCETVRGTHWPNKVAWLFGARVAETILASGPKSPHQQAGHMDASDPIKPSKKLLWHGGRPHMGPGVRRDDNSCWALRRSRRTCCVHHLELPDGPSINIEHNDVPLDPSEWPHDEIAQLGCRRLTSGGSGLIHRAFPTARPIRSACLSCTMTSS